MTYEYTRYTLLIKPNGEFPCKRKYLHDANTDKQALKMAREYAKKVNATIYNLEKEVVKRTDLILND